MICTPFTGHPVEGVHITVWDAFLRFSLHTAGAAFFYLFCPEKVYIAYQLAYDKI